MDIKKAYKEITSIRYDSINNEINFSVALRNYISNLYVKHNDLNYDYKNLKDLFEDSINLFLSINTNTDISFELKIKNSLVYFDISKELNNPPYYKVIFTVYKKGKIKEKKNICIKFEWYPLYKIMEINNLFYYTKDKKIDANKECNVLNIPSKTGDFFIKLVDDISRTFGVKKIFLEDRSHIFDKNCKKIELPLVYLQKYGGTYYQKYGFQPYKCSNSPYCQGFYIILNFIFNLPIVSAKEELEFVKNKLKKIKKYNSNNHSEWVENTQELIYLLPRNYYKDV